MGAPTKTVHETDAKPITSTTKTIPSTTPVSSPTKKSPRKSPKLGQFLSRSNSRSQVSEEHDDPNKEDGRPRLWRRLSFSSLLSSNSRKATKRVRFIDQEEDAPLHTVVEVIPEMSLQEWSDAFYSPRELKKLHAQTIKSAELLASSDSQLVACLQYCYGYGLLPASCAAPETSDRKSHEISTLEQALRYIYHSSSRNRGSSRNATSSSDQDQGPMAARTNPQRPSTVRGLERHMCPKMTDLRKESIHEVLNLQRKLQQERKRSSAGLMNSLSSLSSSSSSFNTDVLHSSLNSSSSSSVGNSHNHSHSHNSKVKITEDLMAKSLRKAYAKSTANARRFARLLGKADASLTGVASSSSSSSK